MPELTDAEKAVVFYETYGVFTAGDLGTALNSGKVAGEKVELVTDPELKQSLMDRLVARDRAVYQIRTKLLGLGM